MTPERTARIRALNDRLRRLGVGGDIMMTQGVASKGKCFATTAVAKVATFNDSHEDNDPYGEHDFGAFDLGGHTIFWRIDVYDATLTYGSPDPTDAKVSRRVLTIMLASEY